MMDMKTFIFVFLFPVLLLSCREEDGIDFSEESRNEAGFVFQVSPEIQTRAEGTTFDAGDKIGIYVVRHLPDDAPVLRPSDNYADNKCYNVVNGTSLEPVTDSDIICASGSGYVYTIYAYYPYNDTISDPTNIYGEVELDQTYGTNFKKSDFMMAQTTCTDENSPINLDFKRKLSCLEVVYDKIDGIVPESVDLYGTSTTYIVNLQTGELREGTHHYYVDPFLKYAETDRQCFYRMIVPPHNLENRGIFKVEINGRRDYYCIDNFVLQAGARHTFYLTGQKRRITYSAFLNDYAGGAVSGMGGEYADRGEIYVADGKQCRVSAKAEAGSVFNGWYRNNVLVSQEADYVFTVTEDVDLTASFSKADVKITIDCQPSRETLAPYYPSFLAESVYPYGYTLKLHGWLLSDSPYTFDGWYDENGVYITRDYEYVLTATKDRYLTAKYGLRIFSLSASSSIWPEEPGYFSGSHIDANKHPTFLKKGQQVRITGDSELQIFIHEFSTPVKIMENKLTIKIGERVVWEGSEYTDFIFTAPEDATYTFHYSMSVEGFLAEGERAGITFVMSRTAWIVE